MRIHDHPILGPVTDQKTVTVFFNGCPLEAVEGEPIAVALAASGIRTLRTTIKRHQPRGIFCAVGQCTDCVMTVNGVPGVRTCVTPVKDGIVITSTGAVTSDDDES